MFKELKKLLKTELDTTTTIKTNLQITKVNNIGNIQLQNWNANSDNGTESDTDINHKNCYQEIIVKINKSHKMIKQELYYQDEVNNRRTYKDWNKKINNAEGIQVEKKKYEAFKDYEKPTDLNEETQIKNSLKASSYYQKSTEMNRVKETIKHYSKIVTI
ncbi:482_t:CDS:1 [Gigaspora rosea]|nr:482_t:CDS:1 [Gigaspora rosea]